MMKKILIFMLSISMLLGSAAPAFADKYKETEWKTDGDIIVTHEKDEDGDYAIVIEDMEDAEAPRYTIAERYISPVKGQHIIIEFDFTMSEKEGADSFSIMENGMIPVTYMTGRKIVAFNNDINLSVPTIDGYNHMIMDGDCETGTVNISCNDAKLSIPDTLKSESIEISFLRFDMQHLGKIRMKNLQVYKYGEKPSASNEDKDDDSTLETEKTQEDDDEFELKDYNIKVTVDGEEYAFERNSPPVIKNERILVPIKSVFGEMKAFVFWQTETQSVNIWYKDDMIKLNIGSTTATRNGSDFTLSNPPVILNGRTYVPLRAISDILSAQVSWNSETRTAAIVSEDAGKHHKERTPLPAITVDEQEIFACPHPWDTSQGAWIPVDGINEFYCNTDTWQEGLSKITGLKHYQNEFNPLWRFDLQKEVEITNTNCLKTSVEIGGQRSADYRKEWSDTGEKAAEAEIALFNNWTKLGGTIEYFTGDHAIMMNLFSVSDYTKGLYYQMIRQQMKYFKRLQQDFPNAKFGLIESLGYFNLTTPDGYTYKQTARLSDVWDFEEFLDDVLDMADEYGVTIEHFDLDYGINGCEYDARIRYGDEYKEGMVDYNRVYAAQQYCRERGLRVGICFNDYIRNRAQPDVADEVYDKTAYDNYVRYFKEYQEIGDLPDKALIQCWDKWPIEVGPETKENTYLNILKDVLADRPVKKRLKTVQLAVATDSSGNTVSPLRPFAGSEYVIQKADSDAAEKDTVISISDILADKDNWSQHASVSYSSETGEMHLYNKQGLGSYVGYNKKYQNEIFKGKVKMSSRDGWMAVYLRANAQQAEPWNLGVGYEIMIGRGSVELYRKSDNTGWNSIMRIETPVLSDLEYHDIELQAKDMDYGVKVSIAIDGETALEYDDMVDPLYNPGYFSLFTYEGFEAWIK